MEDRLNILLDKFQDLFEKQGCVFDRNIRYCQYHENYAHFPNNPGWFGGIVTRLDPRYFHFEFFIDQEKTEFICFENLEEHADKVYHAHRLFQLPFDEKQTTDEQIISSLLYYLPELVDKLMTKLVNLFNDEIHRCELLRNI
jgi:hypothetical protein